MSTYAHAVKVRKAAPYVWHAICPCDGWAAASDDLHRVYNWATHHAATCTDLHWANLAAACPSCRRYGTVAPACPVCLGYGYEREREDLS